MLISKDQTDRFNILFLLDFLNEDQADSGPFILMENGAPVLDESGKPIKTEE